MESIFSLGGICEPSLAMDIYFDAKRANSAFDWLMTPFRSLLAVLQDDGEQFGIDFRVLGGTLFCERYRLCYHHEFARTTRNEIAFSTRQIADLRDKLIYKHRNMIKISRETTTTFIRLGAGTDVVEDQHAPGVLTRYDVEELVSLLRRKLGHNDFKLMLVEKHWPCRDRHEQVAPTPHLHEVRTRRYDQLPDMGFSGDPAFWAGLFASLNLRPDHTFATGPALGAGDVA